VRRWQGSYETQCSYLDKIVPARFPRKSVADSLKENKEQEKRVNATASINKTSVDVFQSICTVAMQMKY